MENTDKANWDNWRHMPEVVLWEAVALSLDIDPGYLQARNNNIDRHKQAIQYDDEKDFNERFVIAERNHGREKNKALRLLSIISGTGREGISLAEFAAWALSIGWPIPQELAELAKERSQPNTQSHDENKVKLEQNKAITSDVPGQEKDTFDESQSITTKKLPAVARKVEMQSDMESLADQKIQAGGNIQ